MHSQLSYEPIFKPPKTAWGRVVYNSRLFKDRMGSQLSYEPIFKPPKTAWGRVVYNSRLFKDRMGSQLSYRPIFRGVTRLGDQPLYSPF